MLRLSALLSVLCCAPALADAGDCRNGSFALQEAVFGTARITSPRAYLRADTAPCPDESVACRGRAYVMAGDTVVTGAISGLYVCAFFPNQGGGSAGYVLQTEAPRLPRPFPSVPAWAGTWRNGDNSIVLRPSGRQLTASGNAYWPLMNPSPRDRPFGPNIGEMSGTATPQGNTVVFAEPDPAECRVELTLIPPFLLARDNRACGGNNVSFTGVYRTR